MHKSFSQIFSICLLFSLFILNHSFPSLSPFILDYFCTFNYSHSTLKYYLEIVGKLSRHGSLSSYQKLGYLGYFCCLPQHSALGLFLVSCLLIVDLKNNWHQTQCLYIFSVMFYAVHISCRFGGFLGTFTLLYWSNGKFTLLMVLITPLDVTVCTFSRWDKL